MTALASRSSERLQGVISFQDDATPICGLAKSSSSMPTALSMPRAAAFSRPSVTSRLRGLTSAVGVLAAVFGIASVSSRRRCPQNPGFIPRQGIGWGFKGRAAWTRSRICSFHTFGRVRLYANVELVWGEMATAHGYSQQKDNYSKRLRRIEGQVRGIARMIDEDKYCIDVLTQISAVNNALRSVALNLLDEHLSHCVTRAVAEGGSDADGKLAEASAAIARLVRS